MDFGLKLMYNQPIQPGQIDLSRSIFLIRAVMIPMGILSLEGYSVLWPLALSLLLLEVGLDHLLLLSSQESHLFFMNSTDRFYRCFQSMLEVAQLFSNSEVSQEPFLPSA